MLDNWKQHNECSPWLEEDNYYIVVDSDWESPGNDKAVRLAAAKAYGIRKLLQFYGKSTTDVDTNAGILLQATVEDYFVSYKPCVRMKVLIRCPQDVFDAVPDDNTACEINKPEEGYLEAILPVYTYKEQMQLVVHTLESTVIPILARSSKFITNVNILAELKRLKQAINIIDRYLFRNGIIQQYSGYVSCPPEIEKILTIGYSYDYDALYALIDNDQHTIGYDCFLNNDIINHLTTAHYLTQTSNMYEYLTHKNDTTFDVFDFLTRFTLPTPIIQDKERPTDGLSLYDDNGVSFGWADLAKIISLDLDINLCKSDEDKAKEDDRLLDPATRRNLQDSANQWEKFVGDMRLSSEGVQSLKNTVQKAADTSGAEALGQIYTDVLAKINIACVVNEVLQCYVDKTIELVGEQIIEGDDELGQVINTSISLGKLVDADCNFQACDGSPDIDLSIGFPIFQGINIPDNFPTFDYLAEIIEQALNQLYAALISTLSSAILRILQSSCSVIFDDVLGEGTASASIKDGFQDWLGESIGIDYEDLNDPQAWGDALTSTGGSGFIGAVGNMIGRGIASGYAARDYTGVSLNLPNPEQGWQVEEYFISPGAIYDFLSDLRSATEDINAVTSESEQSSLYKGSASEETCDLAYECIKLRNPSFGSLFKNKYEFCDILTALGKCIDPKFLEGAPTPAKTPPPDFCHLGDGSDARALREAILAGKDSSLSAEEINTIIDNEIEYNTEKIRSLANTLDNIVNGKIGPPFPNIFGGDDSMIPETPAVISETSAIAAGGAFGAAISNFSIASQGYPQFWKQLLAMSPEVSITSTSSSANGVVETTALNPHPRNLFRSRVHEYVVDGEQGIYKFGYEAFADIFSEEQIRYAHGTESVIVRDFGTNFKGDKETEFIAELAEMGVTPDSGEAGKGEIYEAIMEFIEDHDHINGTHTTVLYDPYDTLISYGLAVYHEGRYWDDNTQIFLVQIKYSEERQPKQEGEVYLNFGNVWESEDEEDFKYLLDRAWDEPPSSTMKEVLTAYASGDPDRLAAALAGGSVTAFSGTLATMLYIAAAHQSSLVVAILGVVTSTLALAALAVTAALVVVAVLIKLFAFKKDATAQRFVDDVAPYGSVTYDITLSTKDKYVKIIKRLVNEEDIISSARPPSWPNNLVSITQNAPAAQTIETVASGMNIAGSVGNTTRLTDWVQDYTIGNTWSNLGAKTDVPGLKDRQTWFPTSEQGLFFGESISSSGLESQLDTANSTLTRTRAITHEIDPLGLLPDGATIQGAMLAAMIGNKLREYFTDSSDQQTIRSIERRITLYDHKRLCDAIVRHLNLHIYGGGNVAPEEGSNPFATTYSGTYWTEGFPVVSSGDDTLEQDFDQHDGFDNINLIYPGSDILGYSNMLSEIQELIPKLLKLKLDNTYCDNLSANRRSNASFGLMLFIRMYIAEQALITPQVYDAFDPSFMEGALFVNHIASTIRRAMGKYQESFGTTLETDSMYNDLLSVSKTYYEIQAALGEPSPTGLTGGLDAITTRSPDKTEYFKFMIAEQIAKMKPTIASVLRLKYQTSSRWDNFVMKDMFPFWDACDSAYGKFEDIPAPPIANIGDLAEYKLYIKADTEDQSEGWPYRTVPFKLRSEHWIGDTIPGYLHELGYDITEQVFPFDRRGANGYYNMDENQPMVSEKLLEEIAGIFDRWAALNTPGTSPLNVPEVDLEHESMKKGSMAQTIGDITYKVDYKFEVDGHNPLRSAVSMSDADYDEEETREIQQEDPAHTLWKISITINGNFSGDYLNRYSATSITEPFYYDGIGLSFERYVEYRTQNDSSTKIEGFSQFITNLHKGIQNGEINATEKWSDYYRYLRFGLRMVYMDSTAELKSARVADIPPQYDYDDNDVAILVKSLNGIKSKAKKNKTFVLDQQPKIINGKEKVVRYIAIPIASAECGYNPYGQYLADQQKQDPTINDFLDIIEAQYDDSIFPNLAEMLWDTPEYRYIVGAIVPLKEIAASFSLYEYAALSDETVFVTGEAGVGLFQMFDKSKLSVLQIIASSIYGAGRAGYIDPFIKKAGTDLLY